MTNLQFLTWDSMIWEAKLVPSATTAAEAALDLFIFCHHFDSSFLLNNAIFEKIGLRRSRYVWFTTLFLIQRCPKHQNCSQSPSVLFGACAGSNRRCLTTVLSSCAEPGADTRGTIHRTGARSGSGNVAPPKHRQQKPKWHLWRPLLPRPWGLMFLRVLTCSDLSFLSIFHPILGQ